MHPELSFEEVSTGLYIQKHLSDWGIDFSSGWAGNGIVGAISGKQKNGPVIALRADMDALPIQEIEGRTYGSQNNGVMHACGHDVHTTCLLGAAKILHELRSNFDGQVIVIFQPGEEKLPGGASIMIEEGLFEKYRPDAIVGLHVHPPLEVGKVGFKSGIYMASADEIYITVEGKGGHAALPQDCIDPVVISAQLITSLQTIISRLGDPTVPSVLSFGKIWSDGGATNVIPDRVYIEGTFRAMDEDFRARAHEALSTQCESLGRAYGANINLDLRKGYPCLINDAPTTQKAIKAATEYLGPTEVVELPIRMTAEDFSYYSHHVPACFFRLGTGNPEKGITSPVHTNSFDIDEDALKVGAGTLAQIALNHLLH